MIASICAVSAVRSGGAPDIGAVAAIDRSATSRRHSSRTIRVAIRFIRRVSRRRVPLSAAKPGDLLNLPVPAGAMPVLFPLPEPVMQIAANAAVAFHYTLTDDDGQVVDSSAGREPLAYLHGQGHIVPGLEKQMEGRKAGDKFDAHVAAEEGYGVRHEELVQEVPREAFQGVADIQPGMQFQGHGPQGVINVTVTRVEDDKVHIDG